VTAVGTMSAAQSGLRALLILQRDFAILVRGCAGDGAATAWPAAGVRPVARWRRPGGGWAGRLSCGLLPHAGLHGRAWGFAYAAGRYRAGLCALVMGLQAGGPFDSQLAAVADGLVRDFGFRMQPPAVRNPP
jgi:hypothetical protein